MPAKFAKFVRNHLILLLSLSIPTSLLAARPLGIDVFAGSGNITWPTVKNAGFTFAWAKATEGTSYKDANLMANEINGKAAGVYMGAYDFCHPEDNSPATEANYFWKIAGAYIKNDGKTFMPMLDFETFGGYVGAVSYTDWANQWCYDVQTNAAAHGVSVTPVIYISACNACYFDEYSVSLWHPWIANYNGENSQSGTPWSVCTSCEVWGPGVWDLWQFTSSAIIPGVPGNSANHCDEDVFNGTLSDLISTFVAGTIAVTNEPDNITIPVGGTATFAVGAIGSGGLKYQWRFNQINIPNATNQTYTIANAHLTDAGGYSVLVTNNLGNVISTAFLSVVAPLMNAADSVLAPANMVNWWTADGNPNDIYGTNNATPYNGLSYVTGKNGLAFHFDGSSGYLGINGEKNLPPNWTVCLWVNRQNAPGTSAALMGDGAYALKLEQYNTTREVGITQSGVADYLFSPAYTVPAGVWTHLTFVGTAAQVTLYANGVLKGSISANNFPLPCACLGVDLLSGNPTDFMRGSLDEVQTFNRALTASEIAAIYNAGSAGLVRAPQFTGITATGDGQIQLNLRGQTGKKFTLYSSTNLFDWTSLGSISNPTGAIQPLEEAAPTQKFYRASQP